jgi:hypothetical protein
MLQSRFRSDVFYLLILGAICALGYAYARPAAPPPFPPVVTQAARTPQGYPTAFPGIAATPAPLTYNPKYNAALSATHDSALSAGGDDVLYICGPKGCKAIPVPR